MAKHLHIDQEAHLSVTWWTTFWPCKTDTCSNAFGKWVPAPATLRSQIIRSGQNNRHAVTERHINFGHITYGLQRRVVVCFP